MAMIMKIPSVTMKPEIPTFSRSGAHDSTIDLGAGEPILGYATHHYRNLHAGTVTQTYADRVCTSESRGVEDVWMTADTSALSISRDAEGAISSITPNAAMARERLMSDTVSRRRPRGFALRTVRTDTVTRGGVTSPPVTSTMEIVELSRTSLDSTLFTVPADYRVNDMRGITISGDMSKMMEGFMKQPNLPGCVAR
jgi:hypothetical protein